MPPRNDFPEPKMRWHNGAWQILWRWRNKQYSVSTGFKKEKEDRRHADGLRRQFAIALAEENPDGAFPEPFDMASGVLRYLEDRDFASVVVDDLQGNWLDAYKRTLTGSIGKGWEKHTLRYLNRLEAFAGDLKKVSPNSAQEYLNAVLAGADGEPDGKKGRAKSPRTHNKVLSSCTKFYKWAVRTKRIRKNPFEGIKRVRQESTNKIVYCTRIQRREAIKLARDTGWPDWLAVPIAFYAGLRREEIARLVWSDVRFNEGLIVVTKSKTGRSRETPLNKHLELMLKQIPESQRTGYVLKMPGDTGDPEKDEISRPNRLTNFVHRMQDDREKQLLKRWGIERPDLFEGVKPRTMSADEWKQKKAEYKEQMKEWKTARKKKQSELRHELKCIGWNPFRHTYASLLVQGGVEIDTVSHWMGNTPEVCRRYYAQFIPRDKRDDRIDIL